MKSRRHALGQHFLKDEALCKAIVGKFLTLCEEQSVMHALEIGPGRGALTHHLDGSRFSSFQVIEKDPRLVSYWEEKAPGKVTPGDFLDLPDTLWRKASLGVLSNLPYSAGTAILLRLCEFPQEISCMVLMFQKEVGRKLRAPPRSSACGSLSLWVQAFWDVNLLFSVPPRSFSPPPKVDSEVLSFRPKLTPLISESDREPFGKLIKLCFTHRRKMLRSVSSLRTCLEEAGIDGTKRAEALEWSEWEKLLAAFKK